MAEKKALTKRERLSQQREILTILHNIASPTLDYTNNYKYVDTKNKHSHNIAHC